MIGAEKERKKHTEKRRGARGGVVSLFDLLKTSRDYYTVRYDENEGDAPTHGPWNQWECEDPTCICHSAEESKTPFPTPWQALSEREERR